MIQNIKNKIAITWEQNFEPIILFSITTLIIGIFSLLGSLFVIILMIIGIIIE